MHAIDTLQTLNGITMGECEEIDPLTTRIIGREPSATDVLAWAAGVTALYLTLRAQLPKRMHRPFDLALISIKGYVIAHNTRAGCQ